MNPPTSSTRSTLPTTPPAKAASAGTTPSWLSNGRSATRSSPTATRGSAASRSTRRSRRGLSLPPPPPPNLRPRTSNLKTTPLALTPQLARTMIRGMGVPGEFDVSQLLSVRQAIDVIDAEPVTPRVERRRLHEAQGLRLAEDVAADRDSPPFDKSLMDGYAVRAADLKELPAVLQVVDVVPAGQWPPRAGGAGGAGAIITRGPMPPGAGPGGPGGGGGGTPGGGPRLRAGAAPG